MTIADSAFTGNIPQSYDRYMGPLYFQPFAADMAARLSARKPKAVLEIAAGTGIVTQAVRAALPQTEITATDLNEAMIEYAQSKQIERVSWQTANAQELPFADASFDAVICQFGVMFFPDRKRAFEEALRVLKPQGVYMFNIWDDIGKNRVAEIVSDTAAQFFPHDPPLFLRRTPFGHSDTGPIMADLRNSGFREIQYEHVELESAACMAADIAKGNLEGSPIKAEINERDSSKLPQIIAAAEQNIRAELGDPVRARISAIVYTATR